MATFRNLWAILSSIAVAKENLFFKSGVVKKLTKNDLLNNLKLNVYLSMKILSYLKNKYGSWELALGAYNTGRPIVNQYALNISNFDTEKLFK